MNEACRDVPLFPLHTVLFPGGPVSLRLFEPRYLDMVSHCLRQDSGFGVVLMPSGSEPGTARFEKTGTMAFIRDWSQLDDGLLGITALGEFRFRVESARQAADGLNLADISRLPEPKATRLPEQYRSFARLLEQVLPQLPRPWRLVRPAMNDAQWVGCRLAELLPISTEDKQRLLEMDDPLERLAEISRYIEETEGAGNYA